MLISFRHKVSAWILAAVVAAGFIGRGTAQELPKTQPQPPQTPATHAGETIQDYNQRLQQLERTMAGRDLSTGKQEYRIGAGDLLEISVMEAPELSRATRVSESGNISVPLLGAVRAAGLTPRQEESVLEELLRRTYMKDPHVNVFVKEMQSHSVSVFGAVKRAGVFQIREAKTLIEILSMAEGLAEDAGDTVLVVHEGAPGNAAEAFEFRPGVNQGASPAGPGPGPQVNPPKEAGGAEALSEPLTQEINVKNLLESGEVRSNVLVYPGDVVKVARAGIVYVVGEVKRPGGFQLKGNENISVLQALALAEGLTRTSSKSHARIIRTDNAAGTRKEIPINLAKVLSGKGSDLTLQPRDILFIPNSTGRTALYRGVESALSVGTGLAVYRW
jgi:polysaccharide export outer membrane protein